MCLRTTVLVVLVLLVVAGYSSPEKKPPIQSESSNENPIQEESKAKPTETSRGALGQGFELNKIDLLSKELQATGSKVFESLDPDACTLTDSVGTTEKDDTFYSSTKSLYSSLSSNTNVGGDMKSEYTFGASVSGVTDKSASESTEISGVSLNLKALSLSTALKQECINDKPLSKKLVKDFEDLDKEIKNPHKSQSWRKYKVFLQKYGSHIVKEAQSGASIYQYIFTKTTKSKKVSQRDLTVKACGKLGGAKLAGKLGISACADVSKKEVEESSDKESTTKLVVRGGKAETRVDLTGELTKEQINKFLKEGQTDPSPIQYSFYSIWTILKARYIGTDHFAKAVNLEQFYKGFLSFGCTYTKINEIELQKFELSQDSDPDAPTYVCKLAPEGCHNDDDCHTKNVINCVVYGDTAVRYNDTELNTGSTKKEAFIYTGTEWEGPGCNKKGFKCKCTKPKTERLESWSGDNDSDKAIRDINSILTAKRRSDQAKLQQVKKESSPDVGTIKKCK